MPIFKFVATAIAGALLLSAAPAQASSRCKVTDPTGTPLNVRRLDGSVQGTLRNGQIVHILRSGHDNRGRPWVYVDYGHAGEGWVYREFISCY